MDDQSSQVTLHTSDSTIGPATSFTDQYVVIDTGDSQEEIIDDHDNNESSNYNNKSGNKNNISVYSAVNTNHTNDNKYNGNNSNDGEEEEDDGDGEDDDPLQVRQLALNFDYLLYNIQDQTQQLAEKVHDHVLAKKKKTDRDIGKINENLKLVKNLIDDCKNVDIEIDKLEQLQLITRDFRERLVIVEHNLQEQEKKSG